MIVEFRKKGATRVQLCEPQPGYYVVQRQDGKNWIISLTTNNRKEAEGYFYWLVLLYTNQVKYIQ